MGTGKLRMFYSLSLLLNKGIFCLTCSFPNNDGFSFNVQIASKNFVELTASRHIRKGFIYPFIYNLDFYGREKSRHED